MCLSTLRWLIITNFFLKKKTFCLKNQKLNFSFSAVKLSMESFSLLWLLIFGVLLGVHLSEAQNRICRCNNSRFISKSNSVTEKCGKAGGFVCFETSDQVVFCQVNSKESTLKKCCNKNGIASTSCQNISWNRKCNRI